jgi:hypothetical protein
MRPVIALTALAACASAEAWLLFTITHHPAGGWGEPNAAWRLLSLYALVPLAIGFFASVLAFRRPQVTRRLSALLWVSVVGPLTLWLALASYGHVILLPMLLGYFVQLGLALVSCLPVARAT